MRVFLHIFGVRREMVRKIGVQIYKLFNRGKSGELPFFWFEIQENKFEKEDSKTASWFKLKSIVQDTFYWALTLMLS